MDSIKQSDIIQLLTTKHIKYVSGPKDNIPKPDGNWVVVGTVGGEILAVKDSTTVRVPIGDVRKVASFDFTSFKERLKKGKTDGKS